MSTLKTGALRGTSGTADSIQLHASDQSVTFPGAVTVTGALTSSTTTLGGKILQIKTLITTGYQANPADWTTVFSQAITPTSSSSKIIVIVSTNLSVGSTSEIQMALYDGTIRKGYREHRNYDDVKERTCPTIVWRAEGSYTAGTEYTFSFQAKRSGGSSDCEIGHGASDWNSTMVVLEIDDS